MNRRGSVYLDREIVGVIEETSDGMSFRYREDWLARPDAQPISLTLPLGPEPYVTRGIHPFFAGLLPEGWLFEISITTLKISADDHFGLLLALCRDCVGAARILPDEEQDRG